MFANGTEYMYSIMSTDSSSRLGLGYSASRAISGVIDFLDDVIGSEMFCRVVTNTTARAF